MSGDSYPTVIEEFERIFRPESRAFRTVTGVGRALMVVARRIDAIEARQRANEVHDPDCPVLVTQKAQRWSGAYLVPRDCACWLSQSTADDEPTEET